MAEEKHTFWEIITEGLIKFGGEIVGVVLIASFLAAFPSLRTLFTDYVFPEKTESQTELQTGLEKHKQEEERLKAELRQREAALKEAEEARRRAESIKPETYKPKPIEKPKHPAMSDVEFWKLCKTGNSTKVAEAIQNGADVNAKDIYGWTALMWVAVRGHTETARVLIQNGADVNARDIHGYTALMTAEEWGHTETANLLRSYGAKE